MNLFGKKPKPVEPTPPMAVAPVTVEPKEIEQPIGSGLQDAGAFYDEIRVTKLYGPTFSTTEFQGIEEIIKDCKKAKWPISYVAYALATAYHETAGTMQPIKEYGGRSYYMNMYDITGKNPQRARDMGNTKAGDGALYCGRGYVQLTWKVNYAKAGKALGIDLVGNPDLAMNPDYASDILIKGMEEGWFTKYSLKNFLPAAGLGSSEQFKMCRKIINGTDKASLIADYALSFQHALDIGKWK